MEWKNNYVVHSTILETFLAKYVTKKCWTLSSKILRDISDISSLHTGADHLVLSVNNLENKPLGTSLRCLCLNAAKIVRQI
jgi:hypothetical protein